MKKREGVTGRDGMILCKALAYAITAIEHLPDRWQEWSDKEDMRMLLHAMTQQADYYFVGARSHLERRGCQVDGRGLRKVEEMVQ
jgi:hypothetical protein